MTLHRGFFFVFCFQKYTPNGLAQIRILIDMVLVWRHFRLCKVKFKLQIHILRRPQKFEIIFRFFWRCLVCSSLKVASIFCGLFRMSFSEVTVTIFLSNKQRRWSLKHWESDVIGSVSFWKSEEWISCLHFLKVSAFLWWKLQLMSWCCHLTKV